MSDVTPRPTLAGENNWQRNGTILSPKVDGDDVATTGYTQLGNSAPLIKMKKFTGTTSLIENGSSAVGHGLISSKILSVNLLIEFTTDSFIHEEYTKNAGYQAHFQVTSMDIIVFNDTTNSENILNKPYKILITYED